MSWSLQEVGILIAALIAAISTAYLAISKMRQENKEKQVLLDEKQSASKKEERNGVLQGEREYSERLEERIEEMGKEIKELRLQVTELYELVNKMQKTSVLKDETAADQAERITNLSDKLLVSKDETKEASVAAARSEGEKAGAAGAVASQPTIKADVKDAVRDVLAEVDENVETVKKDVAETKIDVKQILDKEP